MGRRWWWCRLRRRRLLVAGLFRRLSERGREVIGRLGPARRHGLPANISVPLTKLSGLKRYKVSELKFFDRAVASGGAYTGPEDSSFEMVTLYPGGVYTKSQLLKELETLVSCGMFDRVDLEGKAKPDGTLGLTVSFVESVWSAPKQKLSDSYHIIVAVCIFIYDRKQRMHQALRTSESMLSNMFRRNAVSMIGFVVLRQDKRSFDEWLTGKMKKVIGLDDLLLDYFETGKDELKAAAGKSKHGPKGYNADDEDKQVREEINFCRFVEECEEQAKELDAGDDVPQWGQKVFGCQKPPSILSDTGVENCQLLQSLCGSEQLGFDLDIEQD